MWFDNLPTGLSVHELKSRDCDTREASIRQAVLGAGSRGSTSRILHDVHFFMSKLTQSN